VWWFVGTYVLHNIIPFLAYSRVIGHSGYITEREREGKVKRARYPLYDTVYMTTYTRYIYMRERDQLGHVVR